MLKYRISVGQEFEIIYSQYFCVQCTVCRVKMECYLLFLVNMCCIISKSLSVLW